VIKASDSIRGLVTSPCRSSSAPTAGRDREEKELILILARLVGTLSAEPTHAWTFKIPR